MFSNTDQHLNKSHRQDLVLTKALTHIDTYFTTSKYIHISGRAYDSWLLQKCSLVSSMIVYDANAAKTNGKQCSNIKLFPLPLQHNDVQRVEWFPANFISACVDDSPLEVLLLSSAGRWGPAPPVAPEPSRFTAGLR